MAINDVTLAGGMRNNLVSLQTVSALQARTTERLSTGKRVNNAIDDPSAYFAAQNATNRAADLGARKDSMGEAIQTVKAALQGIDGVTNLIQQAQGLAASARSATTTDRASLAVQFNCHSSSSSTRTHEGSVANRLARPPSAMRNSTDPHASELATWTTASSSVTSPSSNSVTQT